MPVWSSDPPFEHLSLASHEAGDGSGLNALRFSEPAGTPLDAPLHVMPGGKSIADIPPERFFARLATLDLSAAARNFRIGVEAFAA